MKFSEMTDQQLFTKALDLAGYNETEPTIEGITQCYLDYASCLHNGYGVDYYEIKDDVENGEIEPRQMALRLIHYCRGH